MSRRITMSGFLKRYRKHNCAHLWNETYRFNIYVYWPATPETVARECSHWFKDKGPAAGLGGAVRENRLGCMKTVSGDHDAAGRIHLVFIRKWDASEDAYGYLAHEGMHVVNDQLEHLGHPPDSRFDEPHAYLLSWFVRHAASVMNAAKTKGRVPHRSIRHP